MVALGNLWTTDEKSKQMESFIGKKVVSGEKQIHTRESVNRDISITL